MKRHQVVGARQRVGPVEIDLVLPGPAFMVADLRADVHGQKRQADFTAHVFPAVQRGDVQIAAAVLRAVGDAPLLVGLEQIKFAFRADADGIAAALGQLLRPAEDSAGVAVVGLAVCGQHVAQQAAHAAGLRPPRQDAQRFRVRPKQQVCPFASVQAVDRLGIKRHALLERLGQQFRLDGDIFQFSE